MFLLPCPKKRESNFGLRFCLSQRRAVQSVPVGCRIILHKPAVRADRCRFRDPGGTRVFRFCVLDFPGQDTRERMGRMTTRQRQILWFLAIYGLSVGALTFLALLTRTLLRWTTWSAGRP